MFHLHKTPQLRPTFKCLLIKYNHHKNEYSKLETIRWSVMMLPELCIRLTLQCYDTALLYIQSLYKNFILYFSIYFSIYTVFQYDNEKERRKISKGEFKFIIQKLIDITPRLKREKNQQKQYTKHNIEN